MGEGIDRDKLRSAIEALREQVASELPERDFCIHLYGSRYWGLGRAISDVDLAIEFLGADEDAYSDWFGRKKPWQELLSDRLGPKVQLELYDGPEGAPTIHCGLAAGSEVVYTTSPSVPSIFTLGSRRLAVIRYLGWTLVRPVVRWLGRARGRQH
jgi:hypothetical protein